ncbi:uncharacterized protein TM35_000291530 [Trypanosoma theileri]|uniref:Thioredoxin domain-containing protein n=1 Tax=Trypanosoma theileri TaxID=67003 RepID=A0A1X0NNU3_9TRYP|nr:uncharacterized protein TM35_000291530 [Trypanosoma theileri]ORC86271.1 hypothetical protein TM35_000291530 [Trypanosoma theileri]
MRRLFILFVLLLCAHVVDSVKNGFVDDSPRKHYYRHKGTEESRESILKKYTGHIAWMNWRQLVRTVTVAQCTLLEHDASSILPRDNSNEMKKKSQGIKFLTTARSASPSPICHLPIFLFFHRNDCPACKSLVQELGKSAEFELLSEYMTMVATETMEDMTEYYPYPKPHVYRDVGRTHGMRKKTRMRKEESDAIKQAFAGQGEYFPRIYFLFPQNGTLMPIVNSAMDADPGHLNFYHEPSSLIESMMLALQMMNGAVSFADL